MSFCDCNKISDSVYFIKKANVPQDTVLEVTVQDLVGPIVSISEDIVLAAEFLGNVGHHLARDRGCLSSCTAHLLIKPPRLNKDRRAPP